MNTWHLKVRGDYGYVVILKVWSIVMYIKFVLKNYEKEMMLECLVCWLRWAILDMMLNIICKFSKLSILYIFKYSESSYISPTISLTYLWSSDRYWLLNHFHYVEHWENIFHKNTTAPLLESYDDECISFIKRLPQSYTMQFQTSKNLLPLRIMFWPVFFIMKSSTIKFSWFYAVSCR